MSTVQQLWQALPLFLQIVLGVLLALAPVCTALAALCAFAGKFWAPAAKPVAALIALGFDLRKLADEVKKLAGLLPAPGNLPGTSGKEGFARVRALALLAAVGLVAAMGGLVIPSSGCTKQQTTTIESDTKTVLTIAQQACVLGEVIAPDFGASAPTMADLKTICGDVGLANVADDAIQAFINALTPERRAVAGALVVRAKRSFAAGVAFPLPPADLRKR